MPVYMYMCVCVCVCVCACVCVDVGVEHVTKPVIVRTSEQTFEHLNKDGHNIYKHPIICRRQTTLATLVCRNGFAA